MISSINGSRWFGLPHKSFPERRVKVIMHHTLTFCINDGIWPKGGVVMDLKGKSVVVGVCGGIAAYKVVGS